MIVSGLLGSPASLGSGSFHHIVDRRTSASCGVLNLAERFPKMQYRYPRESCGDTTYS